MYIPPKGRTYGQILERQSLVNSRPALAFGRAIHTPPLEMVLPPKGYNESIASPALFSIMQTIANDANELSKFEKDPNAYILERTTLTQEEARIFR
jgi:hypothetical protein